MRFAPAAALRFFRRQPSNRPVQDPADMGTAFGLEVTLEDDADSFRRTSDYQSLESSEVVPVNSAESPLAWLHRRV